MSRLTSFPSPRLVPAWSRQRLLRAAALPHVEPSCCSSVLKSPSRLCRVTSTFLLHPPLSCMGHLPPASDLAAGSSPAQPARTYGCFRAVTFWFQLPQHRWFQGIQGLESNMLMKGTAKELSWAVHACMMVQRPICLQLWNRSPS